ncbi:myotrophin [Drosophila pseudoobscura]|uniref:Myotrophin n=1 Tax=Drosophila pseudoobscura pseudoobscura TaxID=46245 RepID=A0A6I8VII3_DROPS|nr:myotrophin [Drosophila pseudoobscura]
MPEELNIEDVVWTIKNGAHEEVAPLFVNNYFDVNEQMGMRYPMHYAADFGHLKLLQLFIRMGAVVDQKDKYGITPLLAAIWEGHTSCVEYLLQMGAKPNELTPTGESYMEVAEIEEIKELLNHSTKF